MTFTLPLHLTSHNIIDLRQTRHQHQEAQILLYKCDRCEDEDLTSSIFHRFSNHILFDRSKCSDSCNLRDIHTGGT